MTAALELQEALVARLSAAPGLSGVFDDAPARASFPYVVVNCVAEMPWRCVGMEGKELSVELTLWDEQPARVMELDGLLDEAGSPIPSLPTWSLSSLVVIAKKRSRSAAAPWASTVTLRARMFRALGEERPE